MSRQPYVLENEEGTMGNNDYLYLFMDQETAQRYADKYPNQNWKLRSVGVIGFEEKQL